MKKFVNILTVITIIAAVITAAGMGFFFYKDYTCENTSVPDNLSATATVQKYFEYWDGGNARGMSLLTLGDADLNKTGGKYYLPSLDIFCNIECGDCELLDEKAEQYKSYADNAIVSVDFTYKKSLGFGDKSIPESCEGWEFHLVRETENSQWKIISVEKTDK